MSNRTEDFDFHLPESLIAQEPARPRESARLLDATAPHTLVDRHVRDLPTLLRRGDLLVANNTAVIRAQLHALRGEARIGITLDQIRPDGTWHVLVRNARSSGWGIRLPSPTRTRQRRSWLWNRRGGQPALFMRGRCV